MARKAFALLLSSLVCAQQPQPAGVQIAGRLVDLQGKPIAGATIHDRRPGEPWQEECKRAPEASSDRDGRYVFSCDDKQDLLLRLRAHGFCTARYQHFLRATTELLGNTRVPTIALPPAVRLIGRVRSQDGKPIPGARVTARDLAPSALVLEDFAVTDDQGIFQLTGVPASPVELRVEADGRGPVRLLPIDRTSPLDVRMEKAGSCSGTLLSADGKPAEGIVRIIYEDGNEVGAKVAADGRFHFALRPGLRYRLRCESPMSRVNAYSPVFTADQHDIELRRGGGAGTFLEVRASGEAGPLSGFTVMVRWIGTTDDQGQLYLDDVEHQAKDGLLRLPVDASWQPGRGLALIRAPGRAEQVVSLPVRIETGVARLDAALLAERVIRGQVVDATGKPVADALLWAIPGSSRVRYYSAIPRHASRSAADGTFECRGLASADYALNVTHPAHPNLAPDAVSLREGNVEGVKLTLAKARRAEFRWINQPPAGDFWLDLMPRELDKPGLPDMPRWTGGNGRVRLPLSFDAPLELPAVPANKVVVAIHHLTTGRIARDVEVVYGEQVLDAAAPRTLDLRELQTSVITGRVKSTALAALDHLMVRSGTRWPRGPATLLERDGSFRLEVMPGQHTLEVVDLLAGYALARSEPLTVGAGEKTEWDLQVDAGVVDVTIALPDGVTRSALRCLLLERGKDGNGNRDLKQIDLSDLVGSVRLVLPPGEMKIGFQRARAALSAAGTVFGEEAMVTVNVQSGKVEPFVIKEPPRQTDDEVTGERPR